MKRNLSLSMILFLACTLVYGQGEMDAYRMSRNDLSGTARSMGMAGAFGALGGDVTGVSINPGGIGVYRSSEIAATMNFSSTFSSANMGGTTSDASKFKFNFDNLAFMGYAPLGGNVRSFNYGFSFNRLKNFDRSYTARGSMQPSSLTDYIADKTTIANVDPKNLLSYDGDDFDPWPYEQGYPWLSILGYNGALIYPNDIKDGYGRFAYHSPVRNGEKINNVLNVTEKGAIDSYDFTGGVNVNDKLYLGLTMSFTDIGYTYSSRYTENFEKGGGFDLDNSLNTDGSGYQVSVGAIYRPLDALRLGVAYHSPTWYNMTDYVYSETTNDYDDHTPQPWNFAATPRAAVNYKFNTPYRWVFSAAGVIGKNAIISVDYELTDYSGMNLKNRDGFDMEWNPNEFIKQDFRMASMLKAGIEYKITPQTSVRAGYAWQQSPMDTEFRDGKVEVITEGTIPNFTLDGDAHYVTFGLGCRITRNFYVDAAFVYRTQRDDLYFYSKVVNDFEAREIITYNSNPASFKNETYKGVVTLGYKF